MSIITIKKFKNYVSYLFILLIALFVIPIYLLSQKQDRQIASQTNKLELLQQKMHEHAHHHGSTNEVLSKPHGRFEVSIQVLSKLPIQVGESFKLRANIKTHQAHEVVFAEWLLPPNVSLRSPEQQLTLQNLEANQEYSFEVELVLNAKEPENIIVHVYELEGDGKVGLTHGVTTQELYTSESQQKKFTEKVAPFKGKRAYF